VTAIGRPASDEFAEYYGKYVANVPEPDPVAALAMQIELTAALLGRVSDADALKRYAPGKWSVKEVVGHLCDSERVFTYRAMRFARADTTALASFDENPYVQAAGFDRHPLASLVAEFRDVRRASLALFRSFDEMAWHRRGTASGKVVSVRALAYITAGHERHHVAILKERYGLR
jgi:DinB family protein